MPKLSSQVQTFIVTRLACYAKPTEVKNAVAETFGVDVTLPHILYYDATSAGTKLNAELRQLFTETRERFNKEITAIPIANRSYRLARLQALLDTNETRGNVVEARAALEQAAKEVGEYFTNRRELTGAGGGPIAVEDKSLENLTTEQLQALAAKLALGQAVEVEPT